MNDNYMLLEQDDANNAYYLAVTKSGALYYGAANKQMDLTSEWKLMSVDAATMETIH
jgi:hypothetical protein|tara:strand:- start:307 stop:477 length:171 start_codon:yes stop_codon:yes gene_type:complete